MPLFDISFYGLKTNFESMRLPASLKQMKLKHHCIIESLGVSVDKVGNMKKDEKTKNHLHEK